MAWNPTCHQNDERLFDLAREFIAAETADDMLFYVWGHSFEFDMYQSWDAFETFCQMMAEHEEIVKLTNAQVMLYQNAKRDESR